MGVYFADTGSDTPVEFKVELREPEPKPFPSVPPAATPLAQRPTVRVRTLAGNAGLFAGPLGAPLCPRIPCLRLGGLPLPRHPTGRAAAPQSPHLILAGSAPIDPPKRDPNDPYKFTNVIDTQVQVCVRGSRGCIGVFCA